MTTDDRYETLDTPLYPRRLRQAEEAAISERRALLPPEDAWASSPVDGDGRWADDVSGLALSGGGVRSATFNLGLLQALARSRALRRVDFLATVSGGGYIGAYLGRCFDRLREPPFPEQRRRPIPVRVEEELASPDSPQLAWLRAHGNYISPRGPGDTMYNIGVYLRSLLSVHFVVGVTIFALFGLANLLRYVVFDKLVVVQNLVFRMDDLPLGYLLKAGIGPFFSPWFTLFEVALLVLVLPQVVAYWLASPSVRERFNVPALVLLLIAAGSLLYAGVSHGLALPPLIVAISLLSAFIHVELAWSRAGRRARAMGGGTPETQRLRTRNTLTYDLGLSLAISGGLLAFALFDTIGHALRERVTGNRTYAEAFMWIGAVLAAAVPVLRMATAFLANEGRSGRPPSMLQRIVRSQVLPGAMAVALFSLPCIAYSFASHAAYGGGTTLGLGLVLTILAALVTFVLATPFARPFVNQSSLSHVYAARLARAYLGASNPLRQRPIGANITEVIDGDDVPTIRNYQPHKAGGPLHLISVTVTQTVEFESQRGNRDRKGENMAVTSLGLSVGTRWHALWPPVSPAAPAGRVAPVQPVGCPPGAVHPLIDEAGVPSQQAEAMPLRRWMSVSGASIGPSQGQTTRLGTSLLFGMANVRTGHWWDSGISKAAREGLPDLPFLSRLLHLVPRLFVTQSLLIYEWIGRYPGPWRRFWNIADGGFFDNLGCYELIRRRVPRFVVGDASADPGYCFDSLANLVRKARIDFDASIEPLGSDELDALVTAGAIPASQRPYLGSIDELRPEFDAEGRVTRPARHAALCRVRYDDAPDRPGVMLYIKATVPAELEPDVEEYRLRHRDFPHEPTSDQWFDEAQWESYRKLGERLATPLFADPWFWTLRIPS